MGRLPSASISWSAFWSVIAAFAACVSIAAFAYQVGQDSVSEPNDASRIAAEEGTTAGPSANEAATPDTTEDQVSDVSGSSPTTRSTIEVLDDKRFVSYNENSPTFAEARSTASEGEFESVLSYRHSQAGRSAEVLSVDGQDYHDYVVLSHEGVVYTSFFGNSKMHEATQEIEYLLEREFQRFTAVIGFEDFSEVTVPPRLLVETEDDEVLLDVRLEVGQPVAADLDVDGALRLRIVVIHPPTLDLQNYEIVVAEPRLLRAGG